MMKKLWIAVLCLLFLMGCGAETPEETTAAAALPEDLVEIGASGYYAVTDEMVNASAEAEITSGTFIHRVFDPEGDELCTLTVQVKGVYPDGTPSATSVSALVEQEAVSGITVSEHLSGDTATVVFYLNQMSVCHFQYRIQPSGSIEFL